MSTNGGPKSKKEFRADFQRKANAERLQEEHRQKAEERMMKKEKRKQQQQEMREIGSNKTHNVSIINRRDSAKIERNRE